MRTEFQEETAQFQEETAAPQEEMGAHILEMQEFSDAMQEISGMYVLQVMLSVESGGPWESPLKKAAVPKLLW